MLTLVIGGAASGKSAYAESLCLRAPLPRTYLATMQVWDAECAARVAKHRAMRAEKQFDTVLAVKNEVFSAAPYPTWTALGVNWLAGFDFEIKVIARIGAV